MLVTHDQEEAFAVADRMAVMRDGRIVQGGTLDEVWRQPGGRLDGAVPRLRDRAHRRSRARLRELAAPTATWRQWRCAAPPCGSTRRVR